MQAFVFKTLGRIALASILSLALLTFFILVVLTKETKTVSREHLSAQALIVPSLTTHVWGVFNPDTGELLKGGDTNTQYPIASIAKLFTAEAVLQSEKKDIPFRITYDDVAHEGRAGKLIYGEEVTPYTLLFPMLLESSNDAAESIKRYLDTDYENTLVTVQNDLRLTSTHLADASGLSARNVSTIEELARFYAHLKTMHPHILDITQLNVYVGSEMGYQNNNLARTIPTFTGGKQGFTDEAGHTFIGSFILPDGKTEIGIVILQSKDILKDIQALLSYRESLTTSDIMVRND